MRAPRATLEQLASEAQTALGRRVELRRQGSNHRLYIQSPTSGEMDYIADGNARDMKIFLGGIETGVAYVNINLLARRVGSGPR